MFMIMIMINGKIPDFLPLCRNISEKVGDTTYVTMNHS